MCESAHASEFAGAFQSLPYLRTGTTSRLNCCHCVAVLTYAAAQLWTLSELVRDPEWAQQDRTVVMAVGVMYLFFMLSMYMGQRKRTRDDKYFVDAVKSKCRALPVIDCLGRDQRLLIHFGLAALPNNYKPHCARIFLMSARLYYGDAATCLSNLEGVRLMPLMKTHTWPTVVKVSSHIVVPESALLAF